MLLGNTPNGFYETLQSCDDFSPAFIRGILLTREQYNRLSVQQRMGLETFPRWTMYVGPVSNRYQAIKWNDHIFIWAAQNSYVWLPLGTPCIVKSRDLPWPYTEPRWTWIYEQTAPKRVEKRWTGNEYTFFYQDGSPVYA